MKLTKTTHGFYVSDPTDPERDLIVYRFRAALFGSVSSPFMLNAALHYHLCKFSTPIAADIETNLCVDNVISGCESEADAVNYYNTSRSIMGQAKFNLQSWASNSVEVQSQAQTHNVAERDETTKVLGLLWHTDSDILSLASKITIGDHPVTKREILQGSSSIFDPLGLITPVTIQAIILLQELWKQHIDWDEPLEESFQNRWIKIIQEIREATELVIL